MADDLALAVITDVTGSALKPVGTMLSVHGDGTVLGSISAGCVEATVIEMARDVLRDGRPQQHRFGPSSDLYEAATTCGGEVEILVSRPDTHDRNVFTAAAADLTTDRPVALVHITGHPNRSLIGRWAAAHDDKSTTIGVALPPGTVRQALELLHGEHPAAKLVGTTGETLLVIPLRARPRLLIFGTVDVAAATAAIGSLLGYRVTVCDPRPALTTPPRFPEVTDLVVDWPHRYLETEATGGRLTRDTVVLAMSNDPKIDLPLLSLALRLGQIGFVGALGSRQSQANRRQRLSRAGVPPDALNRLHGPIGLDLSATSPTETALSILAEVVADRNGGTGQRLTYREGPLHRAC